MQEDQLKYSAEATVIENGMDAEATADPPAGATADIEPQLAYERMRADQNYSKFLLAMADFENYKKRIERQFSDIAIAGRKKLLEQFLPVLDNLERALAYDGENTDGLRDGVQRTLKGFEAVLASEGVRAISVKGLPFDPNLAEAIGTYDVAGIADDVVVEEAQKGYMLGSELLRPAKVIVAKSGG